MVRTREPPRVSGGGFLRPSTGTMTRLCGCYYEIGINAERVTKPLPRVDVAAHTTIFSTASETELKQTYVNPSKTEDIQECRYVFPLYDGVSVIAFTCQVGSRLIRGVVKEKAEAKEAFDEAVSRGKSAGLLEQGPSTDVFTTTLGNIPAGEKLLVLVKYIGELKHDTALEGIRFTLPTFISPRYGSGAPQGDMDSTSTGGISITVDINMPKECPIEEVRSPSHPIALSLGKTSQNDGSSDLSRASATLSLGTSALEKDFVLEVRHKDSAKARAFLETHPSIIGQRALMTTLVPQIGRMQGPKPEIIIVADQSGSMQGGRTTTLVAALRVLLKSFPVGIKFNICSFGSGYSFLWEKSHNYDENSLAEALKFVEGFGGHLGGTETLDAVRASIESRDPAENLSMILATDGDIWQQGLLFTYLDDQLAKSKKSIRVFPLGIGSSVSSGLIEGVARAGKGFASSVGEGEKLDTKVIRMLKGAMTPDSGTYTMEVQYQKKNDEDEYELVERVTDSLRIMMVDESESLGNISASAMVVNDDYPAVDRSITGAVAAPKMLQAPQLLPPLYPLSRITVYILLSPEGAHAIPKTVVLRNNAPQNRFEVSIPVEILPEPATTLHSLAAKRAVLELEEGRGWLSHARNAEGKLIKDVYAAEEYHSLVKKEAVRLGTQYQIIGKYTSSVAVQSNSALGEGEITTERDINIAPLQDSDSPEELSTTLAGYADPAGSPGYRKRTLPPRKQLASKAARKCAPPPTAAPAMAMSRTMMNGVKTSARRSGARGGAPSSAPLMSSRFSTRSSVAFEQTGGAGENAFDEIDYSDEEMGFGFFDMTPSILQPAIKKEQLDDDGDVDAGSDPLQRLIALQTFAGFWELSKTLLKACSVKGSPNAPEKVEPRVWATLIALKFFELKMVDEKETWEMVADKAISWLEAQGVDDNGKGAELQEAAKTLILGG